MITLLCYQKEPKSELPDKTMLKVITTLQVEAIHILNLALLQPKKAPVVITRLLRMVYVRCITTTLERSPEFIKTSMSILKNCTF